MIGHFSITRHFVHVPADTDTGPEGTDSGAAGIAGTGAAVAIVITRRIKPHLDDMQAFPR